jgi:hypothetical protein
VLAPVRRAASLNIVEHEWGIETEDLLEFVHVVNLRAHRDVGDALNDELEHDRHLVFLHQPAGVGKCLLEFVRILDANRLAAEPLRNGDVIDPVAARLVIAPLLRHIPNCESFAEHNINNFSQNEQFGTEYLEWQTY